MLKTLPLLAAAASLGLAAHAQAEAAKSGAYKLEPQHTQVMFGVSHMGFTTYYGQFGNASGAMVLDAANPSASKLDVTVPVGDVWTPSAKLVDELKSSAWLDAAKFPTMTFHATSITPTGPTTADVAGTLTLHGVTKPLTLKAKFNTAGVNMLNHAYTAGFQVTGTVKRSDFGVSQYVPVIGDNVDLMISAAFERSPS